MKKDRDQVAIKDHDQKEMLYKHFRAQGWMAQIEVPIITEKGIKKKPPQVTDIDVLGIRPSAELRWHLIIGDCKTWVHISPVNRVLWVRGLQQAMQASSSIVLVKRRERQQIERDHKLFADQLGVLLIQEEEFATYDQSVIYPAGSAAYEESIDVLEAIRTRIGGGFPPLRGLVQWLMCGAWAIIDHAILLRKLMGQIQKARGEIDPRRDDHLALIFEMASAFGIPFASLTGKVFRSHLKPDQRELLEDAVRLIIWGGREQYDFYNAVRQQLIAAKGGDPGEQLAFPNWNEFLELLRNYLEAPHLAFKTPQLLRSVGMGVFTGAPADALSRIDDRMLLHLALKLAVYVCRAAKLPQDAVERMKALFNPRITQLVELPESSARAREDQPLIQNPEKSRGEQ
ncbi:MAG: hypothetical protein ACOZF2_06030 [Thermodesulfobacteriota bacterium]